MMQEILSFNIVYAAVKKSIFESFFITFRCVFVFLEYH